MTSYIKHILTVLLLSLLNQCRICFHIYFQLLERKWKNSKFSVCLSIRHEDMKVHAPITLNWEKSLQGQLDKRLDGTLSTTELERKNSVTPLIGIKLRPSSPYHFSITSVKMAPTVTQHVLPFKMLHHGDLVVTKVSLKT